MTIRLQTFPIALGFGLAGLAFLEPVRQSPKALGSFLGAAAVLCVWNVVLLLGKGRRTLRIRAVPRKQHYVQAAAQVIVFACWGAYWPEVYASAPFILAQLAFAYAFDMLLAWSRRDTSVLGFGQFPVILSVNLFLWFRPDWFYLQFAMVALAFAAKELVRWTRDGQRVHIFNPSALPLALVALGLLATGTSGITWGPEIAYTQFYPPHIYLLLFAVGLPAGFLFGVTLMTMSAVVTTYLFGLLYFANTGIYFFYDSHIPVAVFLGMHLLFNDPATSPRTDLGRIVYGALYGLSTVALYQVLGSAGLPTFYDKILAVPLLNLSVRWLDRAGRLPTGDPVPGSALRSPARRLAVVSLWALVFTGMTAADGVGDDHPGQYLPFWQQACEEGRPYACPYLADTELNLCDQGSGWACNEAGLLHLDLARSGEDLRRQDPAGAAEPFRRGCDLGLAAACRNLTTLAAGAGVFVRQRPSLGDYPILLRGSKGPIGEREPRALYALACSQGWPDTCGRE